MHRKRLFHDTEGKEPSAMRFPPRPESQDNIHIHNPEVWTKLLTQQQVEQERIYYKQKTAIQGNNNKIQTEKTNNTGKSQSRKSRIRLVQGVLELVAVGSRGKASTVDGWRQI
jgi:hypothetical protein